MIDCMDVMNPKKRKYDGSRTKMKRTLCIPTAAKAHGSMNHQKPQFGQSKAKNRGNQVLKTLVRIHSVILL